jgi:KRAB domain-containing zinc finger protein
MPCPECAEMYHSTSLKQHMLARHVDRTNKQFKCSHCEYETHASRNLQKHLNIIHNDAKQKHKCPECLKRFNFPYEVKAHRRIHDLTQSSGGSSEKSSAKCDECDMIFKNPGYLLVHYKKVHKKLPPGIGDRQQFLCDLCSEVFFKPCSLKEHIAKKHSLESSEQVIYECPECHKEFTGVQYLSQHYKMAHNATLLSVEGRDNFMCDQCPKVFFSKPSLVFHQKSHHSSDKTTAADKTVPVQQFRKCSKCDAKFTRLQSLREHIKSKHLKETPYKCDQCHRSYGTGRSLKVHIGQMHERQRCNICGKDICNAFLLQRHKASVHGIIPPNVLQCQYCPLFFNQEATKVKHCIKHHSDQM